jgi:hypothetical protein
MSQNNTKELFPLLSSYSLSNFAEGIANAPVGLIFRPLWKSFPQAFPQACGKPVKLKVML